MTQSDCPQCGCSEIRLATQVYATGRAAEGHQHSSDQHARRAQPQAALAPPRAPSNLLSWLISILAFLLSWVLIVKTIPLINDALPDGGPLETFLTFSPYAPIVVGLILSSSIYRVVRKSYSKKRKLYETDRGWWEKTWLCMSCGATWAH